MAELGPKTVSLNLTADSLEPDDKRTLSPEPDSIESPAPQSPTSSPPKPSPEVEAADALAAATMAQGGSSVPPGAGPLYKCAICGSLVYESQLEYHVIICPDPADMSGGPDAVLEGAIAEEDEDDLEEEEEGAQDSFTSPSQPATGSTAGYPRPAKTDDREGGEIAQGNADNKQKVLARRNQMLDDLRRKEEEECTFQPKILNKGNSRICSRYVDAGDYKWIAETERSVRTQKLRQVEAQAYADVTLRPKISRFAQAWSQRQQEVMPDGRMHPSVFERLYQAAMQAQDSRAQREQLQDLGDQRALLGSPSWASSAANSTPSAPRFTAPLRRIETTELLYTDAFDRKERMKSRTEAQQLNAEETMKHQVLDRSRRYYWQMLERQIKAAFEETTDSVSLKFEQLENFLVHFGCMKSLSESQSQAGKEGSIERAVLVQAAQKESNRLRTALWNHLDPNKTGHIDLLTLTVFFHVLMGAVDDAAAKGALSESLRHEAYQQLSGIEGSSPFTPARSSSTSPTRSDVTPITPGDPAASTPASQQDVADNSVTSLNTPDGATSSNGPSPSPSRSASGGCMLAAIFEEDSQGAEATSPRPVAGDGEALAADNEGRRICELLVRFDPMRLRAEFQQLYLHRLHYHHSKQAAVSINQRFEEVAPAPKIDPQSREMAKKLIARETGESGGTMTQHADLLVWRQQQSEARKEEIRKKQRDAEVSGCTFRPKMTAKPRDDMPIEVAPRGSRNETLYARGIVHKERKELRAQEEARARSENEVRNCTFRPDTGKSERSYHRVHDGGAQMPRGFYETRQRLRAANTINTQKRQQREDRMCKISQVSGVNLATSTASASSGPPPTFGEQLIHPLPVVAEDSRLQDPCRRQVKSSSSRGPRSPRVPADNRQTSARQGSDRARSPESDSMIGSAPEDSSSRTMQGGADGDNWDSKASPRSATGLHGTPRESDARRQEGTGPMAPAHAQFGSPASVPSSGSFGGSKATSKDGDSARDADDQEPMMYVDVNIAPNRPPERIVLREGQSMAEVAAEFAAKHMLTPALAQRLHSLLREVSQRQREASLQRR